MEDRYAELTRKYIYSKAKASIPDMRAEAAASSEPGMLQRAIKSQGRGVPLRKLFEAIPTIIVRLKPCFLMSPLSVAQYLSAGFPKFDLVVFDEASQMPSYEAAGALSRGVDAVITGDPNQLPPTTFFAPVSGDTEETADLETLDLESVLDDCLALNMLQMRLLWHYRSEHESLISFSNANYYENRLITFPSPDDPVSRIKFNPVKGIYGRGGSKQNPIEAKAVVDEIFRRLDDPILQKKSIGVVTFSIPQQILIEDMVDEKLRADPRYESYFVPDEKEHIFIKNLENVQGDERDVILFSICYGPDPQGKTAVNFGPVNRDGGWRRLNVAVSRARSEMVVFSSMQSEDIDLTSTGARGAADLKAFLAFAEHGKKSLNLPKDTETSESETDGFRSSLALALRSRGYIADESVGNSKFKIDIAIADPKKKDRYILAIRCDGQNYADAHTADDRDRHIPAILARLGWKEHRVWILDWFEKPDDVIKRIEKAISEANNESGTEKETIPSEIIQPVPIVIDNEPDIVEKNSTIPRKSVYEHTRIYMSPKDQSDFLVSSSEKLLTEQIKTVMTIEAPINRQLLIEKILLAWGVEKPDDVQKHTISMICEKLGYAITKTLDSEFLWRRDLPVEDFETFRVPVSEDERRKPEDLPKEETAIAALSLMEMDVSMPRSALLGEISKQFGYQRTGPVIEKYIGAGIDYAVEKGYVAISDDGKIMSNK
jgi:hypothetical protein